MVNKDPLGRKWENKPIVWIRQSVYIRPEYRYEKVGKKNKLIFDAKNGMYDKWGRFVKNAYYNEVPVLLNKDGTWEEFPDDDLAKMFKWELKMKKKINGKKGTQELCDKGTQELCDKGTQELCDKGTQELCDKGTQELCDCEQTQ
jgi:hypothetical protein